MRFMTTLFCAMCAEAHRPKIRQHYIFFTDNGTCLEEYDHTDTHEYGMTPHTINVDTETDTEVTIASLCMMDKCGVKLFRDKDEEIIYYGKDNKPVIEHDNVIYHLNDKGIAVPYEGPIHFRAIVMREHRIETISKANFNALLTMKL